MSTEGKTEVYRKTTLGILYNLGGKNICFAINFLFVIIIARHLGPADYGSYSFYLSAAIFLVLFTTLGLDYTMNRFVPEIKQMEDGKLLTRLMSRSLLVSLFGLGIVSLFSIGIFYLLPTYTGVGYSFSPFILVLFLGLIWALTFAGIFKGIMSGLFHQKFLNITGTISVTIKLLLTLAFFHFGLNIEGVLLGVLIAYAFPSVLYYSHSKREFGRIERKALPKTKGPSQSFDTKWEEVGRYSFIMFLFAISYFILGNQLDVIMLKFISGNKEAGYYNLAYRFAFINAMVFIGALEGVLVSAFASLKKEGPEGQRTTLYNTLRFTLFFLVPSAVGGVLFSGKIITALFGDAYSSSVPLLQAFYPTLLLSMALSWPLRFLLVSTGGEKEVLKIYLGYGIVNLAGNIILIPTYGGMGAVVATGASAWMIAIHLFHVVRKAGLLRFPWKFTIKTTLSSILGILPFYFVLPYLDALPILVAAYLFYSLAYLGLFLAMKGLTRKEIHNIKDLIFSGDSRKGNS